MKESTGVGITYQKSQKNWGHRCALSPFKVLALAGVLGVSLSAPALADGVAYRDRPGCCGFSWSGLYVGVHAGYGWGDSTWTEPGVPGAVKFEDLKGAIGGGQVGFNWQTGPWVIGIEGTFSGGSIDETETFGVLTTKVEWIATAVGRLGYAWDRSLIYVKGGYAGASVELSGDNGFDTFKASEWHNGWTVGASWEVAVSKNLSLGLEYNFYDLGRGPHSITTANGLAFDLDADTQVHSDLARLNLRFGADDRRGPLK